MILVYIHWRDASTQEAADPDTPIEANPLVDLHEVGYLIAETDESVSLAMEYIPSNPGSLTEKGSRPGRFRLHIPKCNIIDRRNFDLDKMLQLTSKRKRKGNASSTR